MKFENADNQNNDTKIIEFQVCLEQSVHDKGIMRPLKLNWHAKCIINKRVLIAINFGCIQL